MIDLQLLEEATQKSLEAMRIIDSLETPTTEHGNLDIGGLLRALRENFDDETLVMVLPTAVQIHLGKLSKG